MSTTRATRRCAAWRTVAPGRGIFLTLHTGVLFSIVAMLVPPRVRGVAIAVFVLAGQLVGLSVGPALVGFINDSLAPRFGEDSIRYGILISVVTALMALALSFAATRRVERDISKAQAADLNGRAA